MVATRARPHFPQRKVTTPMDSVFGRELIKLRRKLDHLEEVFRKHVEQKKVQSLPSFNEETPFFGGIMWDIGVPVTVSGGEAGDEVPLCPGGAP